MADTFNLGRASGILADALGEPGNRRYRILVRNDDELANLWVERQHLEALGEAVTKIMMEYPASVSAVDPDRPPREGPLSFDMRPSVELQVRSLALGYDEEHKLFVLMVQDVESEDGGAPSLTCAVSRQQLTAFGYAVFALLASGRPRCPICNRPLDGALHDHAQSNGHAKGG